MVGKSHAEQKDKIILAAVASGATPVEFLLAVMQRLAFKKFNGGISDTKAAELAALKAETVSWRMMRLR